MPHEKQKMISKEVDQLFPRDRGNPARQEARAAYNLYRLRGLSLEDAQRETLSWVRGRHPGFQR
jgi:hypothetical protein